MTEDIGCAKSKAICLENRIRCPRKSGSSGSKPGLVLYQGVFEVGGV